MDDAGNFWCFRARTGCKFRSVLMSGCKFPWMNMLLMLFSSVAPRGLHVYQDESLIGHESPDVIWSVDNGGNS